MFRIGDVCLKIAGRDAGLVGVIIKIEDNGYLLLDGQVRRRSVNPLHVEPLNKKVNIKENASHEEVVKALKSIGIEVEKKGEKREHGPRPRKQRRKKVKEEKPKKKGKVKEEKNKDEKKEKADKENSGKEKIKETETGVKKGVEKSVEKNQQAGEKKKEKEKGEKQNKEK